MATIKQRLALAKLSENGGNVGKAMRDAGYSPVSANTPARLTKSKGFQQLVDKYLPSTHLMQKHREFLDSPRTIKRIMKGAIIEEIEETDANAVRALDMAYKLKGSYAVTTPDKLPPGIGQAQFVQIVIHPPHGAEDTRHTADA